MTVRQASERRLATAAMLTRMTSWPSSDGVGDAGPVPAAVDAAPDGLHPGRASRPAREADEGCPFCRIPTLSDEDGLVVARGETVYAVLNLHPYNPGHLMVVPYRHVAELDGARPTPSRPS